LTHSKAEKKREQGGVQQNLNVTPTTNDFFGFDPPPFHPLENSGLASYFPLKDLAFKTPTP